jgi:hypothetical protein
MNTHGWQKKVLKCPFFSLILQKINWTNIMNFVIYFDDLIDLTIWTEMNGIGGRGLDSFIS